MKLLLNEVNNNCFLWWELYGYVMKRRYVFVKLVCIIVIDMYYMVVFMFIDIFDCLKKRNDIIMK